VFVSCFYPLLDGITSLLLTMLEAVKCYFGTIVAKANVKIAKTMNPEEGIISHTIGFQLPDEEEEDDDED